MRLQLSPLSAGKKMEISRGDLSLSMKKHTIIIIIIIIFKD
jgi:hypothetical protein